jgi:hypothetical protein
MITLPALSPVWETDALDISSAGSTMESPKSVHGNKIPPLSTGLHGLTANRAAGRGAASRVRVRPRLGNADISHGLDVTQNGPRAFVGGRFTAHPGYLASPPASLDDAELSALSSFAAAGAGVPVVPVAPVNLPMKSCSRFPPAPFFDDPEPPAVVVGLATKDSRT